jgi:hypothetical protein
MSKPKVTAADPKQPLKPLPSQRTPEQPNYPSELQRTTGGFSESNAVVERMIHKVC